jgi:hypothetical protein
MIRHLQYDPPEKQISRSGDSLPIMGSANLAAIELDFTTSPSGCPFEPIFLVPAYIYKDY